MERWEYELRSDIFDAFASNNRKVASELIEDLISKKSGGLFYRYRPLSMLELTSLRYDQIYFCRAIRFFNHTPDEDWIRFKSYVSCFTDRKNSLSMWHNFAQGASGICTEYSYGDIQKFAEENGLYFSPVCYRDGPLSLTGKVASVMSMVTKPKIRSGEYEWLLWKVDMHSSDIGKIMSAVRPRKVYIGKNADLDSFLVQELREIGVEKDIEIIV